MLLNAKQTDGVLDLIEMLYPQAQTELNYSNSFELLIAVMLSAQTTDKAVNKASQALFERYPNPQAVVASSPEEIEPYIKTIGLYRNKAKFMYRCCQQLLENFDGQVPNNRKDLESLAGVGRKTANVVLSVAFDVPAIAVDTHVERVSKRLKICDEKASVLEVEKTLMKKIPKERWSKAHHLLILFGRYECPARGQACGEAKLLSLCQDTKLKQELTDLWQIS